MGGIERSGTNLANALERKGFQVDILLILSKKRFLHPSSSIAIVEPEDFNKRKLNVFQTIKWIRTQVKKINPERVIVFGKIYGAIVALSLTKTKYDYFLSERSSPLYNWPLKMEIIHRIAFTINPPKGLICQTQVAMDFQRKYYGNSSKFTVIPNIVRDVILYPEISREPIVLCLSRCNDDTKGLDRLINAISKVEDRSWKFYLVGGRNCNGLLNLCITLGVVDRVEFFEPINNLDTLMARAGIFVIPSRSEGYPNALIEAMAAGLPCVSFDFIAGPSEIIENYETGILVENGNISKFSATIDLLIKDESLRNTLGSNALAIRDRLNEDVIVRKYISFIA
jgi:GalNAc-alpha-(1->4)-GalNAc-alpha-(1->3)-diNAcBac-PP-undecaprenol alpha-1,4-N-acetyl-D-galactosaminyltransferase